MSWQGVKDSVEDEPTKDNRPTIQLNTLDTTSPSILILKQGGGGWSPALDVMNDFVHANVERWYSSEGTSNEEKGKILDVSFLSLSPLYVIGTHKSYMLPSGLAISYPKGLQ